MNRTALMGLVLAVAAAALYVSETGDVVYYATPSEYGVLNALGQTLHSSTVYKPLVTSNPMGSCMAVAYSVYNATTWLGTKVELWVSSRLLWTAMVKVNATAIATDCTKIAIGHQGGVVELVEGKAVREIKAQNVASVAYLRNGTLAYTTWETNVFSTVDWCGNVFTARKTDKPELYVNGRYVGEGMPSFWPFPQPVAAVSQKCEQAYAIGSVVHYRERTYRANDTVTALALSGDGSVLAAGTVSGRVYVWRLGSLSAAFDVRSVVRKLALSYDGLTLAVQTDVGVSVYRLELRTVEIRGCPYGLIKAGAFTYNVTRAVLLVPAGARLETLPVETKSWRCVPTGDFAYRMEYRVEVINAEGPEWASGRAVYAAPLERVIPFRCNVRCPSYTFAALSAWRVNDTLLPPVPVITIDVRGPTRIEAVYAPQIPRETVGDGVKYVLRYYVNYSAAGLPTAENPAYVYAHYDTYYLLRVYALDNYTETWARAGSEVVVSAPKEVVGDGVKHVFRRWSTGHESPTAVIKVDKSLDVYAHYDEYVLLSFSAPWWSYTQWAPRGSTVRLPDAPTYETEDTRCRVAEWLLDGAPVPAAFRAERPANISARVACEYLAVLKYPWGEEERWLPEGYTLPRPPERHLVYVFVGWRPSAVVAAPGVYEAAYELDLAVIAAFALLAAAAASAVYFLRRR